MQFQQCKDRLSETVTNRYPIIYLLIPVFIEVRQHIVGTDNDPPWDLLRKRTLENMRKKTVTD